ncbi:MAG: hypothetical protein Q9220_000827 [cf. Caloplaca sp. 1 TL-2023]
MGGIVCQDALLRSRGSADQHTRRVLEHTRCILFLGTPHCGSGLAEWALIGSKFLQYIRRVNHETLAILQHESEVMARIRQDFHTMLREQDKDREIKIVCFYEELPVRAIGEVVPKASATLDRYASIPIHANHMDMTKFSSHQDPDYQNILAELRRLLPCHESESSEANQHPATSATAVNPQATEMGGQTGVDGDKTANQSAKVVNTFSGSFNTSGGKMISGNEFNSGGGPMTF